MVSRIINVVISPTGESQIKTEGFTGPRCREATRDLETALGSLKDETLTTEYHLSPVEQTSIAERNDVVR